MSADPRRTRSPRDPAAAAETATLVIRQAALGGTVPCSRRPSMTQRYKLND
jgi:hypothetical protein